MDIKLEPEYYLDLAEQYGHAMAKKNNPTEYISLWEWSKERIAEAAQLKLLKVLEDEGEIEHNMLWQDCPLCKENNNVFCDNLNHCTEIHDPSCWLCKLKAELGGE